ncbi:MAG: type II secretion system GspH family protein [Candidatus Omnitrophica bacterium]|nr:MAG: hypothetical protein UZ16_OP3001002114 [Candidatus Hinthialibacteria bacterium OLB16]MBE7488194.1 type II secretion system protein [bacterium]MCE7909071.1 type II secretion system protein [Candidatus Omnitrophica bacterium COP1]MCL4734686.1 type II secretion system GspH family protein [Candidatus Omnitrophota bacterium]MBV6482782.1 hypothetical protein [bacterium]
MASIHTGKKAFTIIEVLAVFAVILLLVSIVGVSVANMVTNARRQSAISGIESLFRATQTAALATSRERRVVLRVTYPNLGNAKLGVIYEGQPKVDYWVERKKNDSLNTWEGNYTEPLDEAQSLPAGVTLVDIDGGMIIPRNPTEARVNSDNTFSYFISFVFSADGQITTIQGRTRKSDQLRPPDGDRPVIKNPVLHFMYDGTTVRMAGVDPPASDYDYLRKIESIGIPAWDAALNTDPASLASTRSELLNLFGPNADPNHQYAGRSQVLSLYLLRITGMVAAFDYGIFDPWPRLPLPDDIKAGI